MKVNFFKNKYLISTVAITLIIIFYILKSFNNFTLINNNFEKSKDLYKQGLYLQSIDSYKKLLKLCLDRYGENYIKTIQVYYELGLSYYFNAEYEKALEHTNKALSNLEKTNEDYLFLASVYNNLGLIYERLDKDIESINYYNKSLALYKRNIELNKIYIASIYINLGFVHQKKEDYTGAKSLYEMGLKYLNKNSNSILDQYGLARIYNNYGVIEFNKSNLENALIHYKKAKSLLVDILPIEHPELAMLYYNFGLVYYEKNNSKIAKEYYNKALSIFNKSLRINHPSIELIKKDIKKLEYKTLP